MRNLLEQSHIFLMDDRDMRNIYLTLLHCPTHQAKTIVIARKRGSKKCDITAHLEPFSRLP